MAQQIRLVDDFDKTTEAVGTVEFGWRGKDYAIDLSAKHVAEFETQMAQWVEHARKSGKPPTVVHASTVASSTSAASPASELAEWSTPPDATYVEREQYKQLRLDARNWAMTHGWPQLGEKGRIPFDVYPAWKKAMGWTGALFVCWSNFQRKHARANGASRPATNGQQTLTNA
jgi:hypothetical protein